MTTKSDSFDVVIIGAGPAGLVTAHELSDLTSYSICLIDEGTIVESRKCNSIEHGKCNNCVDCNVVHGFGGSGLYSDGKLCLSNKVGERLNGVSKKFTQDLVIRVDELLGTSAITKLELPDPRVLEAARQAGLSVETYPVKAIPHRLSRSFTSELEKKIIRKKVQLKPHTSAIDFRLDRSKWVVITKETETGTIRRLNSTFLILAVGKAGAYWLLRKVNELGIKSETAPIYFGLRVETSRNVFDKITNFTFNPKFYMGEKSKDYIKTHCFAEGGEVITYAYNHIRVAGGYTDDSPNTSFSVLMEYPTPLPFKTIEYSNYLCANMNKVGRNKIILQRLGDFKKSKASAKESVNDNEVQPTLKDYSLSNIVSILPDQHGLLFLDFVKRLDKVCPGLARDTTLLYGPSAEWVTDKIEVNAEMETCRRNLYVIGDGSGLTQGIVAAASTGLIAAQSIANKN